MRTELVVRGVERDESSAGGDNHERLGGKRIVSRLGDLGETAARITKEKSKNHSTSDSCVVPHRSTNEAVHWLTAQIGRDAVLSVSYGRG